ncbi:GNAT family N-acetyltransferase [Falsiroseomonas sp.]|uniref:GNAT family N-acetyltransferase n=1 Tax=Falsiroseomonas sp. TaxID=2870721 RepID=UPI003F7174DD
MIVTLTERPDLVPLVAGWRMEAFGYPGRRLEDGLARLRAPRRGPEETFVLFEAGVPAATAALSHDDLESRPDLTPWLAGVIVQPGFRGRGLAGRMVRQVEDFARRAGVSTLWLYTSAAAGLYAKLGWQHAGVEQDRGREVALMQRLLD